MRAAAGLALAVLLIGGCAEAGFLAQAGKGLTGSAGREAAEGRFVVGEPYVAGGITHVPREDYAYDETGLAVVVRLRPGTRTANGEVVDPNRLTAQHPTLQLPAIVRVTSLESGRSVLVRVNDRGPAVPGRVIGLSEAAGRVLALPPNAPAQVRVQVVAAESRQVAAEARSRTPVTESERIVAAAAPRPAVQREALPPPPGIAVSPAPRSAPAFPRPQEAAPVQMASISTERLPETLTQSYATPGTLWVQAGAFGSAQNAERMRARLAGAGPVTTSRVTVDGRSLWRVRLGPARSVAEADRLLAAALRAGAGDARIVVD
jgi:rare lipoprotein A